MRAAGTALLLALAWQASARVQPEPRHFAYERTIAVPAGTRGRVCAAIDAAVYEHSAALTDVRLYAGGDEVPYALVASHALAASAPARVLNLGERDGRIEFDLAMPERAYTTVDLGLVGTNFLAVASVSGTEQAGAAGTHLGTFTLFDLSDQKLGRNTELPLAESTFPYLHVSLEAKAAPGVSGFVASPGMVTGATVPPSREAQTIYTTVAETTAIAVKDRRSVATFELPAHVPVERVRFEMEPGDKTNFSRGVEVSAKAQRPPGGQQEVMEERIEGQISRVRMLEGGQEIREEQLGVPATLGSNGERAAAVQVAVENGDDKPLAIKAVKLEMRERRMCFDAAAQPVTMYYGDPKLVAPVYDYARLFRPDEPTGVAQLEAEEKNPAYVAREERRTLMDRHPELIWVALLGVISVLGVVALKSARRM